MDLLKNIIVGLTADKLRLLSDKHLTAAVVASAFSVLLDDIGGLLSVVPPSPHMARMCMESAFNHLSEAVRSPYLEELKRLGDEIIDIRMQFQHCQRDLSRVNADLSQVNDQYLVLRTEQLKITEDYRTSQAELLRVHNEYRLSQNALHEKYCQSQDTLHEENRQSQQALHEQNRRSQQALLDATERYQASITTLRESHQNEISQNESINHRVQTKLHSMNLALVADKQKLLLERSMLEGTNSVPASVTRTQTWAKVVSKNPAMQDLDYPLISPLATIHNQRITDLADTEFANEPEMYQPTLACLKQFLTITARDRHPGCLVWDTHARRNLEGHSPDLTFSIANTKRPDSTAAIAVWELKDEALDDDGRGQVYDYLKIMTKKQSHRTHFFGVLSNLTENVVITLTRERKAPKDGEKNWRWVCRSFRPMRLAYAIAYVRDLIMTQSHYLPSVPDFSSDLGIIDRRLGSATFSVIAAFLVPPCFREKRFARNRWINPKSLAETGLEMFVVKRIVPARHDMPARSVKREIKNLLRINNANGHPNLPQMVYHTNDFEELAITPYGYSPKPGDVMMDWRKILGDVLEALKWLHQNRIIHRDVRWDNIIWHEDHAVLIDLGASVYVPSDEYRTIYDGGNICCPPELIGKFSQAYLPSPADDCYAFFLLVNTLNWPERWRDIRTDQAADPYSDVAAKLTEFWAQMRVSKVWGRYVGAAKAARYEILEELLDSCVYFGGLGKE